MAQISIWKPLTTYSTYWANSEAQFYCYFFQPLVHVELSKQKEKTVTICKNTETSVTLYEHVV